MNKNKLYTSLMSFASKMMLSCESASLLICKKQHEKLNLKEKISLRMHLLSCNLCRRFEDDMLVLQKGMDHYKNCTDDACVHHHLDDKQKASISQGIENQLK